MRPSRRAFTLVELLVVIAIIAILAALFIPALAAAKSFAYLVVCKNNQHQIYIAYVNYRDDHDDRGHPHTNGRLWFREGVDPRKATKGDYVGSTQDEGAYWGVGYVSYLGYQREVFECPAANPMNYISTNDVGRIIDRSNGGRLIDTSYGFNGFQFWKWPGEAALFEIELLPFNWNWRKGKPARQFIGPPPNASTMIVFQDSKETMLDGHEDTPVNAALYLRPKIDYETFRHRGRCSVTWLDGNTSLINRGLGYWDVKWYIAP